MPDMPTARTGSPEPYDADRAPWRAWTPSEVARRLADIRTASNRPPRWAIAGGWALDLFLGRVTREHGDVEVVVLDDDVPSVLDAFAAPAWGWVVPREGWLHPRASPAFVATHQTWLWSNADEAFVLDVFRNPSDGAWWICRREPTIRIQWSTLVNPSAEGIPYLPPEVVLLFKAKQARPTDLTDLRAVLPALDAPARAWLRDALEQVHPGHVWQQLLGSSDL